MTLTTIYVVRHGYRMSWMVDPQTGVYKAMHRTPTGIPNDPALASYGVEQSHQLADKIETLDPAPFFFYSSPFYRCLQTIRPSYERLVRGNKAMPEIRVDRGFGEFFGRAHFEHPAPAALDVLHTHFENLSSGHVPTIIPFVKGETIEALHDRIAYVLHRIIEDVDRDGRATALIICTHAAAMIATGRVLTGRMPEDVCEEDFNCGTCALSTFRRRSEGLPIEGEVEHWNESELIPMVDWKDGKGIQGGWECVGNGDCSFLKGGEERTWRFTGDESFLDMPHVRSSISRDESDVNENARGGEEESKRNAHASGRSSSNKL